MEREKLHIFASLLASRHVFRTIFADYDEATMPFANTHRCCSEFGCKVGVII